MKATRSSRPVRAMASMMRLHLSASTVMGFSVTASHPKSIARTMYS